MFLDPLLTPPQVWMRWAVSRVSMWEWQFMKEWTPSIEGWVGRSHAKWGVTLSALLCDVSLEVEGRLNHPNRSKFESRICLLREMRNAQSIDKASLKAYLKPIVGGEALDVVLFPMLHAYLLDPDLLRHYNYGRGSADYFVDETDRRRVQQACIWLEGLAQRGFSACWLEKLAHEIPPVGPYAAFASYVEMLGYLSRRVVDQQG
jgi:hypothetical protein